MYLTAVDIENTKWWKCSVTSTKFHRSTHYNHWDTCTK